jgi:hypothetical protein
MFSVLRIDRQSEGSLQVCESARFDASANWVLIE